MPKKNLRPKPQVKKNQEPESNVPDCPPQFRLPGWAWYAIIIIYTSLLYANTLWNRYAIDDVMVLTENRFTKQGLGGIKDHFTHDVVQGLSGEQGAHLAGGGHYRPISGASLSIDYELGRKLMGDKRGKITDENIIIGEQDPYLLPALSHALNIILFAITCILVYYFLCLVLLSGSQAKSSLPKGNKAGYLFMLPFAATMLFAAHPIHTEAVANIKGRDEIWCMLFSVLSLVASVKYIRTGHFFNLVWGAIAFLLALLSKENAITFCAIIPLTFFFFSRAKLKQYLIVAGVYAIPVAIYFILRNQFMLPPVTGTGDIIFEPFLLADTAQRFGTAIFVFILYFKLLMFPFPLTNDYYYNQVPYLEPSSILVIASLLINLALLVYALLNLKKKTIPAYAILFYFITFSIVSNLFFQLNILINERLIFMSSLGFCLLFAYLLLRYIKNKIAVTAAFILILFLYSLQAYNRNADWKNNLTLFSHDVKVSSNSMRAHSAYGHELTMEANNIADSIEKTRLYDSAIVHLNRAINIYPNYARTWVYLGNALFYSNRPIDATIAAYKKALEVSQGQGNYEACFNLGAIYNEKNPALAKDYMLQADAMKPGEATCKYLLAQIFAKLNQSDSVTYWLNSAARYRPVEANDYYLVGFSFARPGNNPGKAIEYLKMAINLDPKKELYYQNLGEIYGISGKYNEAIQTTEKLIRLNPNWPMAYRNLAILYEAKGNKLLAGQYQQKYQALITPK